MTGIISFAWLFALLAANPSAMPEQHDIPYLSSDSSYFNAQRHLLDMYWPAVQQDCPMLVFIHGGTWMSGSKDAYKQLGRNLASKGIATAIINYRLGDVAPYNGMAADCAAAVKWVHDHAKQYHGNPSRIAVCGHSAGGHLAALVSLDESYFKALSMPSPVKGCLLIDAFGLNIDSFISSPFGAYYAQSAERIFTADRKAWKQASPVTHIGEHNIPFFSITGSRTHGVILLDNESFVRRFRAAGGDISYETQPGKSHVEMIRQLEDPKNALYEKMVKFMKGKVK